MSDDLIQALRYAAVVAKVLPVDNAADALVARAIGKRNAAATWKLIARGKR